MPILLACARRGSKSTIRTNLSLPNQRHGYLLQPTIHDAIDVFGMVPHKDVTPSDIRAIP